MLEIDDLHLEFSRHNGLWRRETWPVLQGAWLGVQRGELVALVGASGAGKSLLAHAVLGILPAAARLRGNMVFEGRPLTPAVQAALRGRRIAWVPQAVTCLDPSAPARRQVRWGAQAAGRAQAGAAAITELDSFGLVGAVQQQPPHQLSGGMARRVMMAIATVAQADLLIADEPTCGLDAENTQQLLGRLRKLADQGRAVLVITHDVNAVLGFCDRLVVMQDGRTVDQLDVADFRAGVLRHAYTRVLRQSLPQYGFVSPCHGQHEGAQTDGADLSRPAPA